MQPAKFNFKTRVIDDVFADRDSRGALLQGDPTQKRAPVSTNSSGIRNTSSQHLDYDSGQRQPFRAYKGATLIDDSFQMPAEGVARSDRFNNPDPRTSALHNTRDTHTTTGIKKLRDTSFDIAGWDRRDYDIIPESETDTVKGAISDLFSNFMMIKVANHQNGPKNFGIYKALVETLIASDTKYICAIVPNDSNIPEGTSKFLSQLNWSSFQARSTDNPNKEMNGYKIMAQGYEHPRGKKSLLHDKIFLAEEKYNKWVYKGEYVPVTVELLKSREEDTFSPEGYILSAIEMWKTVINLN
jgi:hypothetical protein